MVLYIANRTKFNICAHTHKQALIDIYGEENVFMIDLLEPAGVRKHNYISYGRTDNVLERIPRWLQGQTSYMSNKIIREICDLVLEKKVNLVFSEESSLGSLMKKIKEVSPETYIVCFYHDISADLFAQRQKSMPGIKLHYKLFECNLTIRQESINQSVVDENWVFHDTDAEKFRRFYKHDPDVMVPLASFVQIIPEEIKHKVTPAETKKKILFVCSKYYVNIVGFRWFYDNVLPQLDEDFDLLAVGMGANDLAEFCKDDRVKIVGPVDSLADYYLDADIVITPIFDGGGMKVKTVEAVSYAKCTVGASESLHGYWEKMTPEVRGEIVFQCDTPQEWIDALKKLLHSDVRKYNPDLYQIFMEYFSYESMLEQFKKYLPDSPQ